MNIIVIVENPLSHIYAIKNILLQLLQDMEIY